MKYIRLFEHYINSNSQLTEEELKNAKFRIGDFVKISDRPKANIFVITAIDYLDNPTDERYKRVQYYLNFYPSYERYCWATENSLQLLADYEVDAEKYNL